MGHEHKGLFGLALIVLIGLTAWYVVHRNLYGRYLEHQSNEARASALHEQAKALESEVDASRHRIGHLVDDPIEIEAALRRNKDLVRQGEKVYRIERAPQSAPPPAPQPTAEPLP